MTVGALVIVSGGSTCILSEMVKWFWRMGWAGNEGLRHVSCWCVAAQSGAFQYPMALMFRKAGHLCVDSTPKPEHSGSLYPTLSSCLQPDHAWAHSAFYLSCTPRVPLPAVALPLPLRWHLVALMCRAIVKTYG